MKLLTVNTLASYFYSVWTFIANVFFILFNKSTTIFHGLYSYKKKRSKLKWDHEPQVSGFTAKF